MNILSVEQATEAVYTSVNNDNDDIELHAANLKAALSAEGKNDIEIDTARLTHSNRSGRKMMQSYFKKRGIQVTFKKC